MATVYYKGNASNPMTVPDSDVSYWANQGWTNEISSEPEAEKEEPATSNKTFFRDPNSNDIYDASTGNKIGATDWKNNWSGKATQVDVPSSFNKVGSDSGSSYSGGSSSGSSSSDNLGIPTSGDKYSNLTIDRLPQSNGTTRIKVNYKYSDGSQRRDNLDMFLSKTGVKLESMPQEFIDYEIAKLVGRGSSEEEANSTIENKYNKYVGNANTSTGNDYSMYQDLIDNDPFLKEQFADATIRENFGKMSPTLQMAYIEMMKSLGTQIDAGKVINPNIEITPEQVKKFTDQAITELDPYYQEQINNYKDDLDTSITRLTEDFETGVRNAEDPFKRNLEVVAENEAQAGTVYGSERGVRENINVENQQQSIDEVSKDLRRGVEDYYTTAERTLGSDVINGIETPKLNEYNVSNKGFQKTGTRNLFTPIGGVIGSLNKEKTTAVKGRASELEDEFRQQRLLNINI